MPFKRAGGVLLLVIALAPLSLAAGEPDVTGEWRGTQGGGDKSRHLLLTIRTNVDGTFGGNLISLEPNPTNHPLSSASFTNSVIKLEVTSLGAQYEAIMSPDGRELAGQWRQAGSSDPLLFQRRQESTTVNHPQEPKPPYPYLEERVNVINRKAGVALVGTLTLPRNGGPFPAVLLISGAGPQDRDGTMLGHRPLLVLADHLTRRGIAVLRLDDRGVSQSTGDFATATFSDLVEDALAGFDFLTNRSEINGGRIGLLGQSEGSLVAPVVAARRTNVAFLVLLGGSGVVGEEVLLRQLELNSRATGLSEEAVARSRKQHQEMYTILKEESDPAERERKVRRLAGRSLEAMSDEERRNAGVSAAVVEAQIQLALTPWFRFFLTYDPQPALKEIRAPVLALWGGKDLQVSPDQNLPAVASALRATSNKNFRAAVLPGLNHRFQSSRTGSMNDYAEIEETLAPAVLEAVSQWILRQSMRPDRRPP